MLSLLGGSTAPQEMEIAQQNHMVTTFVVCLFVCVQVLHNGHLLHLCFFSFSFFLFSLLWNIRAGVAIRNGRSPWIGFGRRGVLDVLRTK